MPYNVGYTDSQNKTPITVFDNTSNTDTSLTFPGRNVTGYGQIIAENFLSLLENFASPTEPVNPVEGQIWYNSDPTVSSLLIYNGSGWTAASGIQKSPTQPGVAQSKVGELWVDTVNQQLYVYSGTDWILVGPDFSTGLKSGLVVEQVIDSDDVTRVVLTLYVEDRPIIIISKDSFTPKVVIPQFSVIRTGVNIANPDPTISAETGAYLGGFLPKLVGTATAADSLKIGEDIVSSGKFLRTDITNVAEGNLNIKNDSGITIGVDGVFNISTSPITAKLYNNSPGSAIDLQVNTAGIPSTVLRVINGKVGVNNLAPERDLDVKGSARFTGKIEITDTTATTNINNGAVTIAGGLAIGKNVIIEETLQVNDTGLLSTILPRASDTYDIGSTTRRWNTIRAKTVIADSVRGILEGSISGNAGTATSLQQQTTFQMSGDITAPSFNFNGITGGSTKTFNTSISPTFITTKQDTATLAPPQKSYTLKDDFVLVYRSSISGLLRATRDTFVGDMGVPIGAIFPFAGVNVPFGYLLCDGSEVLITKYLDLYQIIGDTYRGASPLRGLNTFRLPDLRGRFALGKDNMDNGEQIQTATGTILDGGGGNVDRVPGVEADTLGSGGGNNQYTLEVSNLPDHDHGMKGSTGEQYFSTRIDSAVPLDSGAFLGAGGTTPNRVQYLPSSGGINTRGVLNQPYSVMNPYLTINYIIRSGPPVF